MKSIAIVAVLALALGGCSLVERGTFSSFTDEAIDTVRDLSDAEARVYLATPCRMTTGAKGRVATWEQGVAIDILCPPPGRTPRQVLIDAVASMPATPSEAAALRALRQPEP